MKCSLRGGNAKIIARAIQSLSKFGADLFIEVDQQGMQLRALNSSHSAVGTFTFQRCFFDTYQIDESETENYCRVGMKACMSTFRNMKQVEYCELGINSEKGKLQVKLKCRKETVKNALISIIDEENIAASLTPSTSSNTISGSHKLFSEIYNNFNAAEEEITLQTKPDCLIIKNYVEGSRVNEKFMRSQLKLTPKEFDIYETERNSSITFCVKEFKAFLQFAEAINENIALKFEDSGSPIFVIIKKSDQIECLLIMSTLAPEDVSFHEELHRSTNITINESNQQQQQSSKRKTTEKESLLNKSKISKRIANETTLSNDTALFQFHDNNDINSTMCSSVEVARNNEMRSRQELQIDTQRSIPVIPSVDFVNTEVRSTDNDVQVLFFNSEDRENTVDMVFEEPDESIPESPGRVKLRKIFSRCFEPTYVHKEPSPDSVFFAANSDTE